MSRKTKRNKNSPVTKVRSSVTQGINMSTKVHKPAHGKPSYTRKPKFPPQPEI